MPSPSPVGTSRLTQAFSSIFVADIIPCKARRKMGWVLRVVGLEATSPGFLLSSLSWVPPLYLGGSSLPLGFNVLSRLPHTPSLPFQEHWPVRSHFNHVERPCQLLFGREKQMLLLLLRCSDTRHLKTYFASSCSDEGGNQPDLLQEPLAPGTQKLLTPSDFMVQNMFLVCS